MNPVMPFSSFEERETHACPIRGLSPCCNKDSKKSSPAIRLGYLRTSSQHAGSRLRPMNWLPRIAMGLTIAQLSERLRCAECGGPVQSVKPWRSEDVIGKPLSEGARTRTATRSDTSMRETGSNWCELTHLARLRTWVRGLDTRRVTSRYISPSRETSPT
jgi:hypothetical protein